MLQSAQANPVHTAVVKFKASPAHYDVTVLIKQTNKPKQNYSNVSHLHQVPDVFAVA
jgi:hypothetical protein